MKKNVYILFACLLLFVFSCISKAAMEVVSQAASSIGATNCTVGSGSSAGTDGSYKSIRLEFSHFQHLPETYDPAALSSTAALVFFKGIKPEDYAGIDNINVTLKFITRFTKRAMLFQT